MPAQIQEIGLCDRCPAGLLVADNRSALHLPRQSFPLFDQLPEVLFDPPCRGFRLEVPGVIGRGPMVSESCCGVDQGGSSKSPMLLGQASWSRRPTPQDAPARNEVPALLSLTQSLAVL